MSDELAVLDAVGQAELVRRGDVRPAELVEAGIARLEKLNPRLNAVIHLCLERARDAAACIDPASVPFPGVPFLMKDIGGQEAGLPCWGGMAALKRAGWIEPADSHFAERVRSAGLVSLGRTNTPELALLPTTEPDAFGATRNPWSLEHSAGGSSGGAAAAVAAGIVPAAHASDGGGSIRGPASKCGVVGLKPTRGRNSFGPSLGERWSGLSAEFVVSRSVRDSAALLDVTSGPMPGDPYAAAPPAEPFAVSMHRDPGPLRIGVMRLAPRNLEIDDECRIAMDHSVALLEALGHRVEESHPGALDDPGSVAHYVRVVTANTARALEVTSAKVGHTLTADEVEPLTWALAEQGRGHSATQLLETLEFVHRFGRRVASWYDNFDILLTPTQGAKPAPLGYLTSTANEPLRAFLRSAPYGVFTLPFNLTGQPAISLPLHWTADGLPLGSQLVASTGREDLLLQLASQLEQAAPWRDRRPPVFAAAG